MLCLAIEQLNVRHLLALQFVEKGQAFGADPWNHRKFKTVCALQIIDSEDAGVTQGAGTSERQTSALPSFGRQPVLFKGHRSAPDDVRQLCPQFADKFPLNIQLGLANTSSG